MASRATSTNEPIGLRSAKKPARRSVSVLKAADTVIRLAEVIRAYWDSELPKRHPNYPLIYAGEDSGPPPPERKSLMVFLRSLPAATIYKLMLIMYLGRGDLETADLPAKLSELGRTFAKRETAISMMMDKGTLGVYLADGLEKLRRSGVDPNRLVPPIANAGK